MTEQKGPDIGHTHDKLTVILDETEATIRNESQFDKLLSNITRTFPSLQDIDKSQWTLCIQSQVIDENDMDTFQSILSTIPPPAVVNIVWKTRKEAVKSTQVKSIPKYLINVHFDGKKFIHKICEDKDSWDEQIFNALKSAILQKFNLRAFDLYGDEEISVDDIDDIIDLFDEFDSDDSNDEQDTATLSVNIFVKEIVHKPVEKKIERPNISVIHESKKVISLGRRLKLLAQCIVYNKYIMDENDSKSDFEDVKSELEFIPLEDILKDLTKIGLVEGHDENSHTISTLNNISKQILSKDLNEALKTISIIMCEIMPFDYDEFFKLFEKTKETATRLKNKVCWVLLGPTGAGKSTSIHFFCGSNFIKGTGGAVIVDNVDKSLKNKNIKVGEKVTESQTRYIEEVTLDLEQYSEEKIGDNGIQFTKKEPTTILCVDSPGFEDTAGPEVNVANGIGTIRALKKAAKVKVIITFKEAHLDYRFKIIRNIANNMGKAINNLEDEIDKALSPIAGFLTKSEHGLAEAQKLFKQAIAEQKDSDSNENAIFKSIIYKFGKTKALHEIKIDVDNKEQNKERKIKIIKALVEKCGYIESPSTTFNEFISESALSKLKQQIQKNYDTIFNILDNDVYFENPKYIQYIIDILNNIDDLKTIIRTAGGKFVASKLKECMDIFKTKWNDKINKANVIFSDIDINECSINKLQTKMKQFQQIRDQIENNIKVIKSSNDGKYYKRCQLKDINCIHKSLHKCFDDVYQIVYGYLKNIMYTLKSDESDVETDAATDVDKKYDDQDDDKDNSDINPINNYNINTNKNISAPIRKCFELYKFTYNYKEDSIIRKKVKKLKRLVEEVITNLNKRATCFIETTEAQEIKIPKLIFMFVNLSKLHNISIIMDKHLNNNKNTLLTRETSDNFDEFDSANNSSLIIKIIKILMNKLTSAMNRTIKRICKSYSLNIMPLNMNITNNKAITTNNDDNKSDNYYVDVNVLLKTRLNEDIKSRQSKLISFCVWISELYNTLSDANIKLDDVSIDIFTDFQIWLKNTEKEWNEWLCNACLAELKCCNDLLIKDGAKSWDNVQKLLIECESLREVEYIANNTSEEYFGTDNQFDSAKSELSKNAQLLIHKLNNDDEKIDYDEIIKIANQLFNAGCKTDSTEMKQIYNTLVIHVNDLKSKTDAIVSGLSIEMSDELTSIQNLLTQLNTLQKFAAYMPDIKNDANGCYILLNDQTMNVLKDVESKYDLSKCSTEGTNNLRKAFENYLNIKNKVDINILNNVIMKCQLPTLTDLINEYNNKINELQTKNKSIDRIMEEKSGTLNNDVKEYEKWFKHGKKLKMDIDLDEDDLNDWLGTVGHKSLQEIKLKLKELKDNAKKICNKEKEEKDNNINKINEYNKVNDEVQKCVQAENVVIKLLKQGEIIEYRTNNTSLQNRINKIDQLLSNRDQKYMFPKLSLPDAYNSLQFLVKCKEIKWNFGKISSVLYRVNKDVLEYLRKYGDNLEKNLNDLILNLAIKDDDEKCSLNNAQYVSSTQTTIRKLNDCLREFREISNFDHQIKEMEDEYGGENKRKQVKLNKKLFTNQEIQGSVDNYIKDKISMHKNDINKNFIQWKSQEPDKLSILRFICLSMSALDRYYSTKDGTDESYYRIATKISGELTSFGNEHVKQIIPLFNSKSWAQLKSILDTLKKAADANKKGIARRAYRDAVMQLFAHLNKLMNETKTKLLIEINKDNTINDTKIFELNQGLKDVANLVETIDPHLYDDSARRTVKKEEKELGLLLYDRLRQLMKAAIQSARHKEYKKCEKRLDNISRLMEYSNTQFYVYDAVDTKQNDNDNDNEDESDNKIATEYNNMRDAIKAELDEILNSVKHANKSLNFKFIREAKKSSKKTNVFNPYNKLRIKTLHEQLAKSQNEQFSELWYNISDEIINSVQNALNEVKERNNQIQMQSELEYDEIATNTAETMMTYTEQETILRKVKMSLTLFPKDMEETISAMLADAKQSTEVNITIMDQEFKGYLQTNTWDELARNLHEFKMNNPKLYNTSKNQVIAKIRLMYNKFVENMKKDILEFKENIDKLNTFKDIGKYFTKFTYSGNNGNSNPPITLQPIDKILEQMYRDIENKFNNKCNDIKLSLKAQSKYKNLTNAFFIVITVLSSKHKMPQQFAERIHRKAIELYEPIQNLILNLIKGKKSLGLDKSSGDIDHLIQTLDDLKELNSAEFHSNALKLLPFIEEKKENIAQFEEDIESIEYKSTVKKTKEMLTKYKDIISEKGLDTDIIQQNQAKRLDYLKGVSSKCKALIKSSKVAHAHFGMKQDEFKEAYIKPCTDKMKNDIQDMQRQTFEAFTQDVLTIPDLKKANANLEAFYCVKNVFENEIKDDQICKNIKIQEAIDICKDTANDKVEALSEAIQKNIAEEDLEKCAQNFISLEYLNQHMNFKTSLKENQMNEDNRLKRKVQSVIKSSMDRITKKKKGKITTLYNHIMGTDANYGMIFTQQHNAFKASLAEVMNKKFRDLHPDAVVENLRKTEEEMKKQFKKLKELDYDRVKEMFDKIHKTYNALKLSNLTSAKSFDELKRINIQKIANDAKNMADHANKSKTAYIKRKFDDFTNWGKNILGWNTEQKTDNSGKNPRDCYWTNDMRGIVPDLIAHIFAVWTLRSADSYYDGSPNSLMQPRNAQIIAVCSILCLDIDSQEQQLVNNLVEIGTGEGKSVIMAVTAIVLALLGFDVYCACYSELLSTRDEAAFNELFMAFGVDSRIEYSTFNNVLEKMINDGGDIRKIIKDIVLSKNIQHEQKIDANSQQQQQRELSFYARPKILFIDEVDKFFSTDFFGQQYTPSSIIPKEEMKKLILFVWDEYIKNNGDSQKITLQNLSASKQYRDLKSAFNKEWHDLLNESLKDIIDGIRTFKNDSYKIEDGKDIAYKFSDTYSSKVFYGYRTLFTYLHELEITKNITDKNYVHNKLTWFLKCGSFSYSEIPNDFFAILGVTGTLKSLSKKEHEVIQQSYGVKKYVVMPSLFDKTDKLDYAKKRDIAIIKTDYYYNQLHGTIQRFLPNDRNVDRPIIVFFKDEQALNLFYNMECCKTWRINDRIQLLTPDLTPPEKRIGILSATKPDCITFATEEYGRGIDFKVWDPQLQNKGMHVELTYWPDTLAEEIQIKGRTARQGERGSFHIILNEDEIKDQCEVTNEDIKEHQDIGDLYKWLSQIRDKVFEKQYNEVSGYVKELKSIHKQSEKLALSLRNGNIRVAKEKLLLFNKGANVQSAAKLSILIDATGSMSSCLAQCKIVIKKTIPKLMKFLGKKNIDTDSFEIQVVAYRNYNAGADFLLEPCPFTSDENTLATFVHGLRTKGGMGNEAVEVAFGHLNRQQQKPNIVMLMADARAQTKSEITNNRRSAYGEEYWQKQRDGIFSHVLDWKEELNKFMSENPKTTVFTFYLRQNTMVANFEEIARIGRGKAVYLNVRNQEESVALVQSALSETLLLKINNGDMTMVKEFRQEHKNLPTFL